MVAKCRLPLIMSTNKRLPTPIFAIGYGAIVLTLVVAMSMLVSYRVDAEADTSAAAGSTATGTASTTTTTEQDPRQAWNPPLRDEANVLASIRPYLITDVKSAVGETGVIVRGKATETAMASTTEFTGHLSRLLEQNCLDTLVLTTPNNMRISFLGFCFSTLPPASIEKYTTLAAEEDADSVAFVNHNSAAGVEVALGWLDVASESKLSELEQTWKRLPLEPGLDRLRTSAYTNEEVAAGQRVRGKYMETRRDGLFTTTE